MHKTLNIFTIHSEVTGVSDTKLGLCLDVSYLLLFADFLFLQFVKMNGMCCFLFEHVVLLDVFDTSELNNFVFIFDSIQSKWQG